MFEEIYAEGSICIYGMDAAIYCDVFRDAYGYRPSYSAYVFASVEAMDVAFKRASDDVGEAIAREEREETAAYEAWIADIHATARATNARVGCVIRWQFQAHDLSVNSKFDRDHFCYLKGFNFDKANLIRKTQGR